MKLTQNQVKMTKKRMENAWINIDFNIVLHEVHIYNLETNFQIP